MYTSCFPVWQVDMLSVHRTALMLFDRHHDALNAVNLPFTMSVAI